MLMSSQTIDKLLQKNYANHTLNAVEIYAYLINNLDKSNTIDWQSRYNNFFKFGVRSQKWKELYFDFFNKLKTKKPQIQDLENNLKFFYDLQKENGLKPHVEASFISKAMHVLNPDLPIWDNNIRQSLLKLNYNPINTCKTTDDKIKKATELYKKLDLEIKTKITQEKDKISEFKDTFSEHISDTKIIDFYYWAEINN